MVVWSIQYYSDTFAPHHDVLVLPNGNLMMPVWRAVSRDEAIALGRSPDGVGGDGLWLDSIVELQVSGTDDYKVVWQWNSADHLVEDVDPAAANYGALAESPQLIDINYDDGKPANNPDIMHVNSVVYIPEFDQIIIDSLNYSELWVLDHSTTTAEAAGHAGGRYGKGGDILYRWGNPSVYGKADADVFNLHGLHDANWVAADRQIIMFDNNSMSRGRYYPGGNARLVAIDPPLSAGGTYEIGSDGVYGPAEPLLAADLGFEEPSLGSVAKLPDGSYFACHCNQAEGLFLDAAGRIVKTVDMAKNIEGGPRPSFRLTPYLESDPGVAALR
jgi:Arylsulfotransferase (ASST)